MLFRSLHRLADCPKKATQDVVPRCANCGETHPASYRGCETFRNERHRRQLAAIARTTPSARPEPSPIANPALVREGVSFAGAFRGQQANWPPLNGAPPTAPPSQAPSNDLGGLKDILQILKEINLPALLPKLQAFAQKLGSCNSTMEKFEALLWLISILFE